MALFDYDSNENPENSVNLNINSDSNQAKAFTEKSSEFFTEPLTDSFGESITEPLADFSSESITEPLADSFSESIAEPLVDSFSNSITEPLVDSMIKVNDEPAKNFASEESISLEKSSEIAKVNDFDIDKFEERDEKSELDSFKKSLERDTVSSFSPIDDKSFEMEEMLQDESVKNELKKKDLLEQNKNKKGSKNTKKSSADMDFSTKKKKLKTRIKYHIANSVQKTIPYRNVYKNGIIEIEEGYFSRSYLLTDINFRIANNEEQESIFLSYGDLLNSFGPECEVSITINNKNIDKAEFTKSTLIEYKNDRLDQYREEMNTILLDKMSEGKNNLVHEKYLTVTIPSESIEEAILEFSRIDGQVNRYLKKITKDNGSTPLTIEERLEILYNIYNLGTDVPMLRTKYMDGIEAKTFDLDFLNRQGITTKDLIAPSSFVFKKNYFKMGDNYGQVVYVENYPTYLKTDLLPDLSDLAANMLVTVHFDSMPQDRAIKLIKNQMTSINSSVVDAQKQASKSGYDATLISPSLQKAQSEAEKLLTDVTSRNQKLFFVTLVVTHFAKDKEELEKNFKVLQSIFNRHLIMAKTLDYQQEYGFNSSLPLGHNMIKTARLNTTESASVFIPFSAQEWNQKNGFYYGVNTVSRNMIVYNRKKGHNYNGIVLGIPGSGKSFSSKREIVNVILNTDDEVYIIDPEREYVALAKLLGGEVVKISAGTDVHLNPFDLDIDDCEKGQDPVSIKSSLIESICEIVVGGNFGLSPIQKSVIDRCTRIVYKPYIETMQKRKAIHENDTYDESIAPTMEDFYDCLLSQPEPEAQQIALSLELYIKGSYNTFAKRTNVNSKNRFVVYDIKDISDAMRELGLQICLNAIWTKMISNKRKNLYTWMYIDEFHLFAKRESSASYIQNIYKRARKWNGIPTGMTQEIGDLLISKTVSSVISTSEFVMLLNQDPIGKKQLGELFNLSDEEKEYITNVDSGTGLLVRNERSKVPFTDEFPKGNKLYAAMTTKSDDENSLFAVE